jgi:hypothetical protein
VPEDDHPFGVEDLQLLYDLQRVSLLQELIGRVEKNQVETGFFLGQADDGAVELLVHDPGAVLRLALRQVVLDYLDGGIKVIHEDDGPGAAAQRLDPDGARPGEPIQDDGVPEPVAQDVEESFPELGRHWTHQRTAEHLQPSALECAADDPDHLVIEDRPSLESLDVFDAERKLVPVVDARGLSLVQGRGDGDDDVDDVGLDRLVFHKELLHIDLDGPAGGDEVGRKIDVHFRTDEGRNLLAPEVDVDLALDPVFGKNLQPELLHDLLVLLLDAIRDVGVELALADLDLPRRADPRQLRFGLDFVDGLQHLLSLLERVIPWARGIRSERLRRKGKRERRQQENC